MNNTDIAEQIFEIALRIPSATSSALRPIINAAMRKMNSIDESDKTGLMSVSDLRDQGYSLSQLNITDGNIGDFKHVARKYDIDFALTKATNSKGFSEYIVFFKAKDAQTMQSAFLEYCSGLGFRERKDRNEEKETESKEKEIDKEKEEPYEDIDEKLDRAKEKAQERSGDRGTRDRTRGQDRASIR